MLRLPTLILVCALALAGCATLGGPVDIHEDEACLTDSQCLSGRCEFGKCTRFPRRSEPQDENACSFAAQCPGGSCQFGRCTPAPAGRSPGVGSSCIYGADCKSGVCAGLDCH
jgi:hypothetical protein